MAVAVLEVNATRMELSRLKTRLDVAKKGHRLLKNKCDGLVRKLADLSKVVVELRLKVNETLKNVFLNFELAKAQSSSEHINFFIDVFKADNLLIKITKNNVMGVKLPVFEAENLRVFENLNFLLLQPSQFLDESLRRIFEIFPSLLRLAQLEQSTKTMEREIKQTRRKVNALEFLIMPNYVDTIKFVELKLEENERNNVARLSKVKKKSSAF